MNFIRNKGKIFLLIALTSVFTSCASRYENALFTDQKDLLTDTLKTVFVSNPNTFSESSSYRIKPGDRLKIRNIQNVEFGAQITTGGAPATPSADPVTYLVESDGSTTLPVVGKVQLASLTRREATFKLQELFSKTLLKDPIIELSIINLEVTLLGEFRNQGNFQLVREETNLIDIIGIAGGFTDKADVKTLKIIRGEKANPEVIYVNLTNLNSLSSNKLTLQNDDIIYVEPRRSLVRTERVQVITSYVQPLFLLINTAVLIYNLSR